MLGVFNTLCFFSLLITYLWQGEQDLLNPCKQLNSSNLNPTFSFLCDVLVKARGIVDRSNK